MNLCKLNSLYPHGMKPYLFDCNNPTKGWYQDIYMKVETISSSFFAKLLSYGIKEV